MSHQCECVCVHVGVYDFKSTGGYHWQYHSLTTYVKVLVTISYQNIQNTSLPNSTLPHWKIQCKHVSTHISLTTHNRKKKKREKKTLKQTPK